MSQEIEFWKNRKPNTGSKILDYVAIPFAFLLKIIFPSKVISSALDTANWAGFASANKNDLLKRQGIKNISEMHNKSLEICDKQADSVHKWAIGVGVTEGALAGFGGFLVILIDIPFIITLALNTIHKIGLCYGYECNTEMGKQMVLGILSAASANTIKEKSESLITLKMANEISKRTWKSIAEKGAKNKNSIEFALIAAKNFLDRLGIRMTKRAVKIGIPVICSIIGIFINKAYINDVAWAARRVFQERWLMEKGKISVDEEKSVSESVALQIVGETD